MCLMCVATVLPFHRYQTSKTVYVYVYPNQYPPRIYLPPSYSPPPPSFFLSPCHPSNPTNSPSPHALNSAHGTSFLPREILRAGVLLPLVSESPGISGWGTLRFEAREGVVAGQILCIEDVGGV